MRRGLAVNHRTEPATPGEAREAAAKALRQLMSRFDVAEFQAQLHAADMVDMLAGFATDPNQTVEFRRACANDILDRASGKPAAKSTVTILDPGAHTDRGITVAEEIDAVKIRTRTFQQLNELVARRVPVQMWPEDVRLLAGESLAAYAETDS